MDPLCGSTSTVRTGAEAFKEQDRLREMLAGLESMPVPTYILHGSADPIVPLRATDVFEDKGNATRRVHEGLRHEQHHEAEHEAVLAELVAWLQETLPTPRDADGSPDGCRGGQPGGGGVDSEPQPHIRLRGARDALRVWPVATDPRNLIRFVPV